MALTLYRSNQTERLCDALAEAVQLPSNRPLGSRWFVLQGQGMGAFLGQQLAARLGIWGGAKFLYPRNFMCEAMHRILPDSTHASQLLLQRQDLMWRILKLLPRIEEEPWAAGLGRYIGDDSTGLRQLHLARQVAAAFDQYQIYRPEWLQAWLEPGGRDGLQGEQHWQAELWHRLNDDESFSYMAKLEPLFHQRVASGKSLDLPSPIHFFGLSTLPPLYVRMLVSLARCVDVEVYLLSPDAFYYGELLSRSQQRQVARRGDHAQLHLSHVHPLIAGLGKVGADFLDALIDESARFEVQMNEVNLFEPSRATGSLGRVQRALMGLKDGEGGQDFTASEDDHDAAESSEAISIAVHSCHGAMREVEVLHDQLLAQLNESDLQPHDVVVMMSDVQTYAPLVEAVFGKHSGSSRFIPYRVIDRSLRSESPVAEALLQLLDLGASRFEVSAAVAVLKMDPVRERLGLDEDACAEVERWLQEMRVAWALDAQQRKRHDQHPCKQNTWQYGLERVLLGYAMSGEEHQRFCDVAPYDRIEVAAPEALSGFVTFCAILYELDALSTGLWSFDAWQKGLLQLAEAAVVRRESNAWEHRRLSDALGQIAERVAAAEVETQLSSSCWTLLLKEELEQPAPVFGFGGSGVTFCAMVPMRAIPFAVVCLLGMGDKGFPRNNTRSSFDLMGQHAARAGDRSRRDDDRYLFLEALLSARRRLYVYYSGQSVRDNSAIPASVVLSELLDVIAPGDPSFVLKHRLQPFSESYFDGSDPRLFSFDSSYLEALGQRRRARENDQPKLFDAPLVAQEDEVILLDELRSFFASPAAHLLRKRLGVDLRDFRTMLDDREPLQLSGLDGYQFNQRLWELCRDEVEDTAGQMAALGLLPLGTPGRLLHRTRRTDLDELLSELSRCAAKETPRVCDVHATMAGGERLVGQVDQCYSSIRIAYRLGTLRAKHLLAAWVEHLALAAGGSPRSTRMLGFDKNKRVVSHRFRPVEEPLNELRNLIELYRLGCRQPLLLFPEASRAFVKECRKRGGGEDALKPALKSANRAYLDRDLPFNEPLTRIFSDAEEMPLSLESVEGPTFATVARRVFEPLLDHHEEGSS